MIADKHTIQVKGIGRVSRTPDTIIVWMHVESCDTDYKQAVDSAAQQLNLIRANLGTIGFTKEDLKTTSFDIMQDMITSTGKTIPTKRCL